MQKFYQIYYVREANFTLRGAVKESDLFWSYLFCLDIFFHSDSMHFCTGDCAWITPGTAIRGVFSLLFYVFEQIRVVSLGNLGDYLSLENAGILSEKYALLHKPRKQFLI